MTTIPTTNNETATAVDESIRALLKQLSNEQFLRWEKEAEELHREIGYSVSHSFSGDQRQECAAMKEQVAHYKKLFDEERSTRVLNGWRARYERLCQALQPLPQQPGRKLIPINAEVAEEEALAQTQRDEAIQKAAVLAQEFLEVLKGVNAAESKEGATAEREER